MSCQKLVKIEDLIVFDQAVMMFKIDNKLCLENLWNKLQLRCQISRYVTKHCKNLEIPKASLERKKGDFTTPVWRFGTTSQLKLESSPWPINSKEILKNCIEPENEKHDSQEEQHLFLNLFTCI